MKKSLAVIFFFVLYSGSIIYAEEIPVNLKADKLKIIEGTSLVEASGSVEVKLKDATIYADHVFMDSATNVATADGHVRLLENKYHTDSTNLTYNIDTQQAQFTDFHTRLSPSSLRGPLLMTARRLKDQGKLLTGEKGNLTTCDNKLPHYFLTADKVEYYPDDKVIGYNATLYIGELPVLWLPVLYYDLHQQGRHNWTLGHNDTEGDYFKSTWGYSLGLLYLDLMEKKGFGYGTQSNYDLYGLGAGTLFLYHLDEKDTGLSDWISRINFSKQITPWTKLTLNDRYTSTYMIPSGRTDQTEFGLNIQDREKAKVDVNLNTLDDRQAYYKKYTLGLSQALADTSTNYDFNYEYTTRAPGWMRQSQRLTHRRTLWPGTYLNTRADYYSNIAATGQPADERLEPMVELGGQARGFAWRLSENWYFDLDNDTYTGDNNYQYLEKKPELEITPDTMNLHWFRLQSKFTYGYYHEVRYVPERASNRDFATNRSKISLDLDQNFALGLGTTLGVGAGIDQLFYGPGDALYNYHERASLQTDLGKFFRNDLNYQKGISDGNSPFLFDQLGSRYHNVTDRITFYNLDRFRWTFDGGFNWQSHLWNDVMTALMLKPASWLAWNSRSGWSIEQRQYRDFINGLTVTPCDFFSTRFSSVSDLNNGQLKVASVNYDLFVLSGQPNQWHFNVNQILDVDSQQFKVRDIMVTKELHCWQLIYTYSDYRKEFSFTISLKALPDQPVGLTSSQGFHFDALENQLKELQPQEGAVQRY